MAQKAWIVLTDTDGRDARINVSQICYYRASGDDTVIVFGGDRESRMNIRVRATCEEIDEAIGGDLHKPTYGMMNVS